MSYICAGMYANDLRFVFETGSDLAGLFIAVLKSLPEKVLDLVHPGFGARIVMSAVLLVDALEFAQQFLLTIGQIDRSFHDHMAVQIAVR